VSTLANMALLFDCMHWVNLKLRPSFKWQLSITIVCWWCRIRRSRAVCRIETAPHSPQQSSRPLCTTADSLIQWRVHLCARHSVGFGGGCANVAGWRRTIDASLRIDLMMGALSACSCTRQQSAADPSQQIDSTMGALLACSCTRWWSAVDASLQIDSMVGAPPMVGVRLFRPFLEASCWPVLLGEKAQLCSVVHCSTSNGWFKCTDGLARKKQQRRAEIRSTWAFRLEFVV